jgi:pentatricopeptide repeat protein
MAYDVYLQAKRTGVVPSANTFTHLLSLLCGLGEAGSGSSQVRLAVMPHNIEAALIVREDMKRAGFNLHETSYSSLIRCCCTNGRFADACLFYEEMKFQSYVPKLRTMSPLLVGLCALGDIERSFTIYDEMTRRFHIQPTEREYQALLKAAMVASDKRFEEVLHAMMDEIMVLRSNSTVSVLIDWFTKPNNLVVADGSSAYSVSYSDVDETGYVAVNGETLQSVDIDASVRSVLLSQLESFAVVRPPDRKIKINNKVKDLHTSLAKRAKNLIETASDANEANQRKIDGGNREDVVGTEMMTDSCRATDDWRNNTVVAVSGMLDETGAKQASLLLKRSSEVDEGAGCATAVGDETAATLEDRDSTNIAVFKKRKETHPRDAVSLIEVWTRYKSWLERHARDQLQQTTCSSNISRNSRINGVGVNIVGVSDSTGNHGYGLDQRRRFDVIIDGANVGYYKQNYAGAPLHVDYGQIDQMIEHLLALHRCPVVFMHARHTMDAMVPDAAAAQLLASWRERGLLYVTPKGFNDDWFWLYGAVRYGCQVVTNDEMRDHHFQLLSPKYVLFFI